MWPFGKKKKGAALKKKKKDELVKDTVTKVNRRRAALDELMKD